MIDARCLIVRRNPTETQVAIVVPFLNGVNSLVRVDHEVIIESYGGTLLVRVALKYVVVNELFALVSGIRLLLCFICIPWKADVLTVSNLVLTIIWLEIVEHILPELKINVDRDFVRVTRVHFTQLIVNV